jgi:CheY-like chemotaxis protein
MSTQRKWKVLLIDDSEVALEFETVILTRAGFEVRASQSVDEFSAALDDWAPDVILSDVHMPGITGVELCRRLKERYDTAHVPVILCSSIPRDELAQIARACDADGFLSKADGLDDLAEELRQLCDSVSW